MSHDNKNTFTEAPSFHTNDGHTLANIELTDNKQASSVMERFLANSLNVVGIDNIFGYQTRRNLGTGELFTPDGKSAGQVPIYGKGFQKRKP